MFIEHTCPHCRLKLKLEPKDIRQLTDEENKEVDEYNKNLLERANEKIKVSYFFGLFIKEKYKYEYGFKVARQLRKEPIGIVNCVCGKESYINKESYDNDGYY